MPLKDDWPPEENLLILDIDLKLGDFLATEFDQKAYLHGRLNRPAILRVLETSIK